MLTTAIVAALTLVGLAIASAAIKPLRDVAALASSRAVRRAWSVLIGTIVVCIVLQAVALVAKLRTGVGVSDLLEACVHLLGPSFVLAVARLARRTARDIVRIADLERAALVDPLTQLPNRRAFERTLAAEIAFCRRSGAPLHLVLLDIDHFKDVNDSFGHRAGDSVLRQVALLAQSLSRDPGLVCRIGGEEFAIITPRTMTDHVLAGMEQMRSAIDRTRLNLPDGGTIRLTVSFGAAALMPADTAETLFGRADAALYASKHAGRNRTSLAA